MRSGLGELITEVNEVDQQETVPLGTAQWMGLREATQRMGMSAGNLSDRLWIGEAFNDEGTPLGYTDDRHVTLVSGTRGGKGAGIIVPNLCQHRGSCIVIDPKGENATVTARRRGNGSDYAHGLGQEVRILDPFNEVPLASELKARFNPLDVIDPESDLAVDDAGRIAAAIIVKESKNDPYWEDAARGLVKGLILHILSFPSFKDVRNLITLRRLLMEGDWIGIEAAKAAGVDPKQLPTPHEFLWQAMIRNKAFGGIVAGIGEQMFSMAKNAEKAFTGVIEQARTNTIFLDGAPMRRLLEKSDFDLASIKTSRRGLTIYLTLPQRYMDTHFRWLRLMVTLTLGEMERIKGRPKTGFPTLFLLDEFPGLKRMEVIENAVAQAAGFGVKFFFVTQNLPQLKREYDENWETFISNSGLKMFFQIDDHFSRDYLSNLLGEREVRRSSRSGSDSQSTSFTEGVSSNYTSGSSNNTTYSGMHDTIFGERGDKSVSYGSSSSNSRGTSQSTSQSNSRTDGWSEGVHKRPLLSPDEIGRFLSRIDDKGDPAYPGLVLALTPGHHPLAARRINYFSSPKFEGCFDPHPDHPPPLTLAELEARNVWRDAKRQPLPPPEPEKVPEPVEFWDSVFKFLLEDYQILGLIFLIGCIAGGIWLIHIVENYFLSSHVSHHHR
jgi:type IV secretory pathway TraG/TraD family ATPase VirD4